MPSQHKVLLLNEPLTIYGVTPQKMVIIFAAIIGAFLVSTHVPYIMIGHLPLSFVSGILVLSLGVGTAEAISLRPPIWWFKRFSAIGMRQMPHYLPDVHFAGESNSDCVVLVLPDGKRKMCMKCEGIDLLKLDQVQREDVANIFISSASAASRLQVLTTSLTGPASANTFYLIFDEPLDREVSASLLELVDESASMLPALLDERKLMVPVSRGISRLRQAGLPLHPVSRDELRSILFAHLSPASFARGESPPPSSETTSELLGLCKTGFLQKSAYIVIDETYCSVLRLTRMPYESYVGWLRSLLSLDCRFTTSLHFEYCNQERVRRQAAYDLRVLRATRSGYAPLQEPYSQMPTFIQGGLNAFDFACYIAVYASSQDELHANVGMAKQLASNCGAVVEVASLDQLDALISCLPIGMKRAQFVHRILSPIVGTCWPFVAQPNSIGSV